MKEKNMRSVLMLCLILCLTIFGSMNVSAKTIREKRGFAINLNTEEYIYSGKASKISGLKSSNKKVADFITQKDGDYVEVYLKLKKSGTTQLTYKVKRGNTKDIYKIDVTVFKYVNPFKTLKIGKKNYASVYKRSTYYNEVKMGVSGKLDIAVKRGWEVAKVRYAYKSDSGKIKTIKKNAKVIMDIDSYLEIWVKNKKYGFTMQFGLYSPR